MAANNIKNFFPALKNNKNLVYLDSAAKALTLNKVIEKEKEYYEKYPANVFRGLYGLSIKATEEYEATRKIVAKFLGAKENEIVFTSGTTQGLNTIANGIKKFLKKGDEIIVSVAEHHSNFVPWQVLAKEKGIKFKVLNITSDGKIDIKNLEKSITKKTKVISLFHISNVTGAENNISKIAKIIKKKNKECVFVVDGAQSAPHKKIDVKKLGCDFFVFSAHKMLGPTGIGILWGKYKLLEKLEPQNYGGEMISFVKIKNTQFKDSPHKFEAGTPNIAGVIAFKEALLFLEKFGFNKIQKIEKSLVSYCFHKLKERFKNKIEIIGPQNAKNRHSLISFSIKGLHPHDIADILAKDNICVRAGHHCCQPLHNYLNLEASIRASFYLYNTKEDVDEFINSLEKAIKTFY
ncbi:Cysteine desulfurase SufS [bacterium HR34]|nr:Cysteine desulfurase SufS [bacterium HR34]